MVVRNDVHLVPIINPVLFGLLLIFIFSLDLEAAIIRVVLSQSASFNKKTNEN